MGLTFGIQHTNGVVPSALAFAFLCFVVGCGPRVERAAESASSVPAGMVAFVDEAACPPGWTVPTDAVGRLLMFTDQPSRVGKTTGQPLAHGAAPSHRHTGTASLEVDNKAYFTGADGCTNGTPFRAGKYEAIASIAAASGDLPFMPLRVCEAPTAPPAADPLPYMTFGFFRAPSCPVDWTRADECPGCPKIGGRFAVPAGDAHEPFAVVGSATPNGVGNPHSHGLVGDIHWRPHRLAAWGGSNHRASGEGGIRFPFTSSNATETQPAGLGDHIAPMVEYLACVKTQFRKGAAPPPDGLTVFVAADHCPVELGWERTPGTEGRLILGSDRVGAGERLAVGSPRPLGDREDRAHTHGYSVQASFPSAEVCLNGGDGPLLAESGSYTEPGLTSAPSPAGLPYVQLRQCTFHPPATAPR